MRFEYFGKQTIAPFTNKTGNHVLRITEKGATRHFSFRVAQGKDGQPCATSFREVAIVDNEDKPEYVQGAVIARTYRAFKVYLFGSAEPSHSVGLLVQEIHKAVYQA